MIKRMLPAALIAMMMMAGGDVGAGSWKNIWLKSYHPVHLLMKNIECSGPYFKFTVVNRGDGNADDGLTLVITFKDRDGDPLPLDPYRFRVDLYAGT